MAAPTSDGGWVHPSFHNYSGDWVVVYSGDWVVVAVATTTSKVGIRAEMMPLAPSMDPQPMMSLSRHSGDQLFWWAGP